MGKYIEKVPPKLTGDTTRDLAELLRYQTYLREQINFLLSTIYKKVEGGE
jgi:hypothetical protein